MTTNLKNLTCTQFDLIGHASPAEWDAHYYSQVQESVIAA